MSFTTVVGGGVVGVVVVVVNGAKISVERNQYVAADTPVVPAVTQHSAVTPSTPGQPIV